MPRKNKKKVHTGYGNTHFVTFSTHGRSEVPGSAQARQIVMAQLDALARRGERLRHEGY